LLARFGTEDHDEGYGILRELGACVRAQFAFCSGLYCFAFGHDGGIVLQEQERESTRRFRLSLRQLDPAGLGRSMLRPYIS